MKPLLVLSFLPLFILALIADLALCAGTILLYMFITDELLTQKILSILERELAR